MSKKLLIDYCNYIEKYWHPTKNKGIDKNSVLRGSDKIIWVKCENGHEFQRQAKRYKPFNFICPRCDSLEFTHPDLVKHWHPTKNKKPIHSFSFGSDKIAWWRCDKGHEFKRRIKKMAQFGFNCPDCKLLIHSYPEVAAQWHPTKNQKYDKNKIQYASKQEIWWQCAEKHEYKTTVYSRTLGKNNCPKCSRESKRPDIHLFFELMFIFKKVEWQKQGVDIYIHDINFPIIFSSLCSDLKNNNQEITNKILKHIFSKHPSEPLARYLKDGVSRNKHYFSKLRPSWRNKRKPLDQTHPGIAQYWNYKKNFPFEPSMFVAGSNQNVWWRCDEGHEFQRKIHTRTRNVIWSCVICKRDEHYANKRKDETRKPSDVGYWIKKG